MQIEDTRRRIFFWMCAPPFFLPFPFHLFRGTGGGDGGCRSHAWTVFLWDTALPPLFFLSFVPEDPLYSLIPRPLALYRLPVHALRLPFLFFLALLCTTLSKLARRTTPPLTGKRWHLPPTLASSVPLSLFDGARGKSRASVSPVDSSTAHPHLCESWYDLLLDQLGASLLNCPPHLLHFSDLLRDTERDNTERTRKTPCWGVVLRIERVRAQCCSVSLVGR